MNIIARNKLIAIILFLCCFYSKAQPTNVILVEPPVQNLLVGTACRSDAPITNIGNYDGYYYPSNFTGITKWQFAPSTVFPSNQCIFSFSLLLVDTNQAIQSSYRLIIYTNNFSSVPALDTGEIPSFYGYVTSNPTNILTVYHTNNLAGLGLNSSNIVYGTLYWKANSAVGNWYTKLLTGASIRFR